MIKTPIFPQGTRVRVRRGPFPIDPGLVGRSGMVVAPDPYEPTKYGVVLDGESEIRELAQEELERVVEGAAPGKAPPGPAAGLEAKKPGAPTT